MGAPVRAHMGECRGRPGRCNEGLCGVTMANCTPVGAPGRKARDAPHTRCNSRLLLPGFCSGRRDASVANGCDEGGDVGPDFAVPGAKPDLVAGTAGSAGWAGRAANRAVVERAAASARARAALRQPVSRRCLAAERARACARGARGDTDVCLSRGAAALELAHDKRPWRHPPHDRQPRGRQDPSHRLLAAGRGKRAHRLAATGTSRGSAHPVRGRPPPPPLPRRLPRRRCTCAARWQRTPAGSLAWR